MAQRTAHKRRNDQSQHETDASVPEAVDTQAVDDLLDEIDEVLEVNALDFVRDYVQKGGE